METKVELVYEYPDGRPSHFVHPDCKTLPNDGVLRSNKGGAYLRILDWIFEFSPWDSGVKKLDVDKLSGRMNTLLHMRNLSAPYRDLAPLQKSAKDITEEEYCALHAFTKRALELRDIGCEMSVDIVG